MDEFQIYIHPVVVGKGKPFFKGLAHQRELQLIENRGFNSGVVGLRYRTSRQRICVPDTLQGPSLTTSP
jgi:dihydrofolate reductase